MYHGQGDGGGVEEGRTGTAIFALPKKTKKKGLQVDSVWTMMMKKTAGREG